ncbi:flagellar protein FlaG [Halanaerobium saccharolyticum]|jgi:flagellar protein FlaG|uniref:Flagellar protein FlaG n=1 Tax=Halanaerobium saccharolyticum TaxID=43595 RepID=A0A4R6RS31_9FIRM|nr:flagellar protein FlaG [Halanaerobium saccharolyticum]TDP89661.1 flagellar protein FlaG [Halanaerobium saccharolyticum]
MRTEGVDSLSSQQLYNNNNNSSENIRTEKIKSNNKKTNRQATSLQEKKEYNQQELEDEVRESVKDVNEIVDQVKEGLSFQIHEDTEELMVQVIDVNTDEVIKELPPEEMLDLKARIHEMVGILIDEKV